MAVSGDSREIVIVFPKKGRPKQFVSLFNLVEDPQGKITISKAKVKYVIRRGS